MNEFNKLNDEKEFLVDQEQALPLLGNGAPPFPLCAQCGRDWEGHEKVETLEMKVSCPHKTHQVGSALLLQTAEQGRNWNLNAKTS